MATHHLKTHTRYFKATESGLKNFEIRDNTDRGFQKGDVVELHEIDPETLINSGGGDVYTGRSLLVSITYVTNYEQKLGFVVFGFTVIGKINPTIEAQE